MEGKRGGNKEAFPMASLPPPRLFELSSNGSGLADLKLNESGGHDMAAKPWNATSRSGEGRSREVMMSFMPPWSGHIWKTPVTSGKRDICKL